MKHKPNSLFEAAHLILEGFNDKSTIDQFSSSSQIIQILMKDPAIKKHVGKDNLYFDDANLVYGDNTVKTILGDRGWDYKTSIADLKKLILKMPSEDDHKKLNARAKPKADEAKIGKFIVKLPKEFGGVHGAPNVKMSNPRAIIDADDKEALMIKKLLHNPKETVTVRIMKRKDGNKVYVDSKNLDNFNSALDKLKKIV